MTGPSPEIRSDPPAPEAPAGRDWRWWLFLVVAIFGVCFGFEALRPGYFWNDDFQAQFLPIYSEIADALKAGELPFVSRYTAMGGAIVGEYQYGVFSIFVMGWNSAVWSLGLTLSRTAAALASGHLVVLGLGVFSLARARGRSPEAAAYASLCTVLSAWLFLFGARNWFPALTSFAWLPWAWFFQMKLARPGSRVRSTVLCAVSIYLVFAAGWPFTVLMLALVALQYLYDNDVRHDREAARGLVSLACAWLLGLALAAPALLTLVKYMAATHRAGIGFALSKMLSLPPPGVANFFVPGLTFEWFAWEGWEALPGYEVYEGLVTPSAILAALLFSRGKQAFRSSLWRFLVLTFVLLFTPTVFPFRWTFRWFPVTHLVQNLFAAEILDTQSRPEAARGDWASRLRRAPLGFVATVATLGTWVVCRRFVHDETPWLSGALVVLAAGFWWFDATRSDRRQRVLGATFFAVSSLLCLHASLRSRSLFPTWTFPETMREPSGLDGSRRYFSLYVDRDVTRIREPGEAEQPLDPARAGAPDAQKHAPGDCVTGLYPGNSCALGRLDFVNGYSPTRVMGIADIGLDHIGGVPEPEEYGPWLEKNRSILEHLGVDGLVFSSRFSTLAASFLAGGWTVVPGFGPNIVLHRVERMARVQSVSAPAPRPVVLGPVFPPAAASAPYAAEAKVGDIHEERSRVTATVDNRRSERPALITFARPWFPGYSATWNGAPAPLRLVDSLVPAIEVPPGASGIVTLSYVPAGLVPGLWLAGGALTVCAGLLSADLRRRRRCARRAQDSRAT